MVAAGVGFELGMEKLRGPAGLVVDDGEGSTLSLASSNLASAASRRSRSGIAGTAGSSEGMGVASDCVKASREDCASSFSFRLLRRMSL